MEEVVEVKNHKGSWTVSTREIAGKFRKPHKVVLLAIRSLGTPEHFNRNNFIPIDYVDKIGRKQKEFLVTRDGFSMLAMGFTGHPALEWKLKFLEAFNTAQRVMFEQVPKLKAEIAELRLANRKMLAAPGKKRNKNFNMVDTYGFQETLFDGEFCLVPITKPKEQATEFDLDMHKMKHCGKIGMSNLKKARTIMNKYSGSSDPLHQTVLKAIESA